VSENIPRRCSIDKNLSTELFIRAAIKAVENMPADVRLTHAVNFLGKALDAVADYIDGVPVKAAEPAKSAELKGVCKHGIRWPHACQPCADAAWEARDKTFSESSAITQFARLHLDPIHAFLSEVEAEHRRAVTKFPDASGSMTALTEEVGELAKALLDEPSECVRAEAVQVATMAIRVALEGDHTLSSTRTRRGADRHPARSGEADKWNNAS
jgi:hypothetical protein